MIAVGDSNVHGVAQHIFADAAVERHFREAEKPASSDARIAVDKTTSQD